jgi:TonB family protein
LLSLIGALLLLIGLARWPLPQARSTWVSWGYVDRDPITLSDLVPDAPEEPSAAVEAQAAGAPPPTTHAVPVPRQTAPARSASEGDDATAGAAPSQDAREPVLLSALRPTDVRPVLVGGQRSLYLKIRYPAEARNRGIQGRVMLDFVVEASGDVRGIRVAQSLHPLCDSSAVQALRQTRFVPGHVGGEPVAVRMRLPIRFRLVDSPPVADAKPADAES